MNHPAAGPLDPSPDSPMQVEARLDSKLNAGLQSDVDTSSRGTANGDAVYVEAKKLNGRARQIVASVCIPHPVEQVWSILTDYERLADFIPSLKKSTRISHPSGGIRIEQIGSESLLKLQFCARVVLDMVETFPHRLGFEMVDGDFKHFAGEWQLQPQEDGASTALTYTVNIVPSRLMPVGMIEKRLSQGLQVNLAAVKQRASVLFTEPQSVQQV